MESHRIYPYQCFLLSVPLCRIIRKREYRYTESRLAKLTEDGLLCGMKKNVVNYILNYSETKNEPVTLPSLFPNLFEI